MNKIINHFYDDCELTANSLMYMIIIMLLLIAVGFDRYYSWQCDNYQEVTGFESMYVEWDACFIKGSDGVFVKYDDKYKGVK